MGCSMRFISITMAKVNEIDNNREEEEGGHDNVDDLGLRF